MKLSRCQWKYLYVYIPFLSFTDSQRKMIESRNSCLISTEFNKTSSIKIKPDKMLCCACYYYNCYVYIENNICEFLKLSLTPENPGTSYAVYSFFQKHIK